MRIIPIFVALGCIFPLTIARTLNSQIEANQYYENGSNEIDDVIDIDEVVSDASGQDADIENNKGVIQTVVDKEPVDHDDDNDLKGEALTQPGIRRFRRWTLMRPCRHGFRLVRIADHMRCIKPRY